MKGIIFVALTVIPRNRIRRTAAWILPSKHAHLVEHDSHLPNPVDGCRTFDLHQVDAQTLLIGLDNRVWTFSHTAGTDCATSADGKAAGRVQLLLETHFSGDMGFLPESAQANSRFFSPDLNKAIARFFAVPRPPNEVPPIIGDPFTDSQEYPIRFAVSEATGDDVRAKVEVVFANAWSNHHLAYHLVHETDGWKLDDIVYPNG